MTNVDTRAELESLEELVDRVDLTGVLSHLSTIAYEKAEHLRVNWQDERTARDWDAAGRYLDTASTRRAITDTSPVRGGGLTPIEQAEIAATNADKEGA